MKEKMDKIDILKEEMMKFSEKRCSKLQIGGLYFRPTLNNLGKTWELWKLVSNAKEGKKIKSAGIKRKPGSLGLRKTLSLTT